VSRRPPRRPLPRARKRLGQHFLTDPGILGRIADALDISGGETVVEIGPGRGALTDALRDRLRPGEGRLIAVELDAALAALLRERYAGDARVEVVERDVLDVALGDLAGGPYLVAGNVPYYTTTPIIFHALESPRPERAVYLVQREVAERVVAAAGDDPYGALSANVQAVARAELLFRVPAGAFRPRPTVDSAVLRLSPRPRPAIEPALEGGYRRFVLDAFALRRKQMRRVLRTMLAVDPPTADRLLDAAGVSPDARPETLTPEQFAELYRRVREEGRGRREE
jgi:16S rRNA (adenine1518-N6/adenine1519-N6)-dimethyltransferase